MYVNFISVFLRIAPSDKHVYEDIRCTTYSAKLSPLLTMSDIFDFGLKNLVPKLPGQSQRFVVHAPGLTHVRF